MELPQTQPFSRNRFDGHHLLRNSMASRVNLCGHQFFCRVEKEAEWEKSTQAEDTPWQRSPNRGPSTEYTPPPWRPSPPWSSGRNFFLTYCPLENSKKKSTTNVAISCTRCPTPTPRLHERGGGRWGVGGSGKSPPKPPLAPPVPPLFSARPPHAAVQCGSSSSVSAGAGGRAGGRGNEALLPALSHPASQ